MRRVALLMALLVIAGFALPTPRAASQQPALQVVTSIGPLADLIRNVGGERVDVLALVPPGAELEDYDPTPADAAAVSKARIFFANGLGLEAYLDNLVQSAGGRDLEVVTLSEGAPTIISFGQGSEAGGNPHLWLDPQNAAHYVGCLLYTSDAADE